MPDLDRRTRDAAVSRSSGNDPASSKSRVVADDHDSPWKEALELYFPQALALLASDLHAAIDWAVPIMFLDKELQASASTPPMPSMPAAMVATVSPAAGPEAEVVGGRRDIDRGRDVDGRTGVNDCTAIPVVGGGGFVNGASAQGGQGGKQNGASTGAAKNGGVHEGIMGVISTLGTPILPAVTQIPWFSMIGPARLSGQCEQGPCGASSDRKGRAAFF